MVRPAALWHLPLVHTRPPPGPTVKVCPFFGGPLAGDGGFGALPVIVTSVPTPYKDLSTCDWAFLTPAEAAVTVTTSPIPSARPSAMKIACRILRRNSLR